MHINSRHTFMSTYQYNKALVVGFPCDNCISVFLQSFHVHYADLSMCTMLMCMCSADVRVHGADLRVRGADVRVHGADVRVHGADVRVHGAHVHVHSADVHGADVCMHREVQVIRDFSSAVVHSFQQKCYNNII